MKKKIDVSQVASSLRGESVFFPIKNGKPATDQAGKPRENGVPHRELVSPAPKTQEEKKPDGSTNTRTDANVHTRTHARIDASTRSDLTESLYRKLQQKHHLSSYTFRYRLEELEALRKLDEKFEKSHPNKMSKNDLVRIGVNWLLEDYEQNGETSMLARILVRM
jgi:hypothetical protein